MSRRPRWALTLVRIYPGWWRGRYENEFQALLADHGLTPRCVYDVVLAALLVRLRGDRSAPAIDRRCGALAAALWAAAAYVPIGLVLGKGSDPPPDPLWVATDAHPLAWVPLALVILGVLGIGLLGLCASITVVIPALREAWRSRRPEFVRASVAIASGLALVVVSSIVNCISWTRLTPAQARGAAALPLSREIVLSATVACLLVALLVVIGAVTRLVRRVPAGATEDVFVLAFALAICTCVSLAGAVGWGLALLAQAPHAFGVGHMLLWIGMLLVAAVPQANALAALARCRPELTPLTPPRSPG
jgi:hypothetical protein